MFNIVWLGKSLPQIDLDCICAGKHMPWTMCKSQRTISYHVDTQVIRLGSRHSYLLPCLLSPGLVKSPSLQSFPGPICCLTPSALSSSQLLPLPQGAYFRTELTSLIVNNKSYKSHEFSWSRNGMAWNQKV